jgi:hypothetical protein
MYFDDKGAIIDAPLDYVWQYLLSEQHGPAHARSARNFELKETVGATNLIAAERNVRGNWSTFLSKSTDYPPLCIVNEEVEGEFAGTKFVVVYTPEGNVTRVDVYGDVRSAVYPPARARELFLEMLQGAYEDDAAQMRRLRTSDHRGSTAERV